MRDDVHERLLAALEDKLPAEVLDTWIRPLRVLDTRENRLELSVPNKFFRQQIEQRYLEPLQAAAEAVAGPRAQLVLTIDRTAPAPRPPKRRSRPTTRCSSTAAWGSARPIFSRPSVIV